MTSTTIRPQNCLKCGADSVTKIVCDECYGTLTKSQRLKFDAIFQRIVIELFHNVCVDCDHSAETASGELCADHLQRKNADPLARYDLAAAVCRCSPCHNGVHAGTVRRVPPKSKMPKQTQEKQAKHKRPAVCSFKGCPIWAAGSGHKKPDRCWKHQP